MPAIRTLIFVFFFLTLTFASAQKRSIALRAATVLDGKGKTLHNTTIVVSGAKIVSISGVVLAGAQVYALGAVTVTPGWLSAHSLKLVDQIGCLSRGTQADIVAFDGNPSQDVTAARRAVFVMKSGQVVENLAHDAKRGKKN